MQDHVVLLPSPNSAFTWTGRQHNERVLPNYSLRKRLLFGGSPSDKNDVKAEVNEIMRNNQSAFIRRWNCRCNVIVCRCEASNFEPIEKSKIPKYDWSPIDKPLDDDEVLLDDFQMKDVLENRTIRPEAPVPFSPFATHFNHSRSNTSSSGSENELTDVVEPSTYPLAGCLTPPSSPDISQNNQKRCNNSLPTIKQGEFARNYFHLTDH